jgi:phage shock protein E
VRRRLFPLLLVLALALSVNACGSGSGAVERLGAGEAVRLLDEGDLTVIDVRTPAEFASGHVAGAVNVDFLAGDFTDRLAELDRGAAYLLYCQSGNRSAKAAARMADLGFVDLVDAGGVGELRSAGAEIVPGG